jgi:phage tail-like protein
MPSGPGKMSGLLGELEDPLSQAEYWVDVPKLQGGVMVFRECSGIGSESDVIEYKGAKKDDYHSIRMVPGRLKWQRISLKRGITSSMIAWDWRKEIEMGNIEAARCDGSIVMVNQNGVEVARWNFFKAWPSKITGPTFNAATSDVGVEELELVHEKLERVK